ncbi:MAG: hypothetical protein WBL44_12250 [Nitrososphaeraceae archaeon]
MVGFKVLIVTALSNNLIVHQYYQALILGTAREAEIIHDEGGFKNKVVLVYHLPSVISIEGNLPFRQR